jgi:AraC-like DNA-binding protein
MVEETARRRPGWEAALFAGLLRLMVELSRLYEAGDGREDADLRGLGELISRLEREAAQPWTVAEMCRCAHMSRSSLIRAFHRTLGLPPMDYLIEKRLDLAQRLLLDTDLNITEIALECGFSDGNYFTRQFRRRRGTTPTQFRRG